MVPREHCSRPYVWGWELFYFGDIEDRMTEFTIRPVEPRDETSIARLWQSLTQHLTTLDPRLPGATPGAPERYASRLLERSDDALTRAYVAEADDRVVGYILGAIVELHPDLFEHVNAGYIADIFVEREYRRMGIGAELVETMLEWFVDEGIRNVEWQVAAADANALDFWSAMDGLAIMVRMRMMLGDEDEE